MRIKKVPVTLFVTVIAIAAASIWYVNDYYHSNVNVMDYRNQSEIVQIVEIEKGLFLDGSGEENALIFYPGAKVEYTSYLPLFHQLAQEGVDCFLLKMPGNLAILGQDMAADIMKEYEYERWYLSGHSLGGAMIASYASSHPDETDGLILLAAYPTKSLIDKEFQVLSIYGSKDLVLNMEKMEEGRALMPEDYKEVCLEGGNHAWFGNYGIQEGDGEALLTREEQQSQTIQSIVNIIFEGNGENADEE